MKTAYKLDLKKIRKLRRGKDLSCKDMAEKLGYKSPNGYHYLESGRCQISAEQLAIISTILETHISDLYISNEVEKPA